VRIASALASASDAGQLLDLDDIGAVRLADRLVLLAGQQVIVAARQAETRLAGHHRVAGWILLVGGDADADRAGIAMIRHQQFERAAILHRIDACQIGLERRRAACLDPGFVHIGVVEGGDLAKHRIAGRGPCILDQRADLDLGLVGQVVVIADARLVRCDRRVAQPTAQGIGVEIVPRLHAAIHGGEVDAPGAVFRLAAGGLGEGGRNEQRSAEQQRCETRKTHGGRVLLGDIGG